MGAEKYTDAELWVRFKDNNDKVAYKKLYVKFYKVLYNYGFNIVTDSELVEDSIQELFLKIWKNRSRLAEIQAVKPYLITSYSRILMDAIKKQKRTYRSVDLEPERENNIEEMITAGQLKTEVQHSLTLAMDSLSNRQKEVIYLSLYKGLSYKEISEIIPIKYQTIRNCMHEAIKILRKRMIAGS